MKRRSASRSRSPRRGRRGAADTDAQSRKRSSRSRSPRREPSRFVSSSRSRSRSRSERRHHERRSRRDEEDAEKRARKKVRKDKKEKKKHKDKREKQHLENDAAASVDNATARAAEQEDELLSAAATTKQSLDVRSFFDRIKAQEAGKESIGTIHASGIKAPMPTALASNEQWECVKRGCGHKNNKKAAACNKCGAMKRLSEWR